MPPLEREPDPPRTKAEMIARAKAARARLYGPVPVRQARLVALPEPVPVLAPVSPAPAQPSFMLVRPPKRKRSLEPIPLPAAKPPPLPQEPDELVTRITVAAIIEATARHCKISIEEIMSYRRTVRITRPRQIAMTIARRHGHGFAAIARAFGAMDHTTVIHSKQRIEGRLEAGDLEIAEAIKAITTALEVQFPNAGSAPKEDVSESPDATCYPVKRGRWTNEEKQQALEGRLAGKKLKTIAFELGRSERGVRHMSVQQGYRSRTLKKRRPPA